MRKQSTISYKIEPYQKINEVNLHGQMVKPLYIQVIFKRKKKILNCYYFKLFSKSRYFLSVAGIERGPTLEEIKKIEIKLIDFIIAKHPNNFSLEIFESEYRYYSTDLCDATEEQFVNYMFRFFQDEGVSAFAVTLREGSRYRIAYDVVHDLKKILAKPKYDKLIENSSEHAPPYLILYGFMLQTKKWPMLSLSIMEWEKEMTQHDFIKYIEKYHPNRNPVDIIRQVNATIKQLGK